MSCLNAHVNVALRDDSRLHAGSTLGPMRHDSPSKGSCNATWTTNCITVLRDVLFLHVEVSPHQRLRRRSWRQIRGRHNWLRHNAHRRNSPLDRHDNIAIHVAGNWLPRQSAHGLQQVAVTALHAVQSLDGPGLDDPVARANHHFVRAVLNSQEQTLVPSIQQPGLLLARCQVHDLLAERREAPPVGLAFPELKRRPPVRTAPGPRDHRPCVPHQPR